METLAFFPTPYPNEDFRSVVYRYHHYISNSVFTETTLQLFGIKLLKIRHLPRNISFLQSVLHESLNISELLHRTTLLKIFLTFTNKEQGQEITNDVIHGSEAKSSLAGVLSGSSEAGVINKEFRYCSGCLNDDYLRYGECYVHKYHQMYYLDICYKHHKKLMVKCPTCDVLLARPNGDKFLSSPQCINGHDLTDIVPKNMNKCDQLKQGFISDIVFLSKEINHVDADEVSEKIIIALGSKGYIGSTPVIYKSRLLRDIFSYFTEPVLKEVGLRIDELLKRRTMKRMLKPQYMNNHILLYVLIMRYLAGTVEKFFRTDFVYATELPFGFGPWKCPSAICANKKLTVNKMGIERSFYIGEFRCNECGNIYFRKKAIDAEDEPTLALKDIGIRQIEHIQKLYSLGWKKKNIAEQLGISLNMVSKYIVLDQINRGSKNYIFKEIQQGFIEAGASLEDARRYRYRDVLLSALREGNVSTRVELRALKRLQYNWLSKNDKKWFEENMPAARKGGSEELNFSLIDLDLSEKISSISERLYREDLSKQIKPYTILVQLSKEDFGRYQLKKNKLPLSRQRLEECSEKKGDYLLRILPRVVEYLRQNTRYRNITFESIRSVRRVFKGCSESDRNRIEEALNKYLAEKEREF